MDHQYDLVIVGAGCIGMAAAYYALKYSQNQPKSVCLIEKSDIEDPNRYWSSSFSARQNRVQYNEQYLTRFVLESNDQWLRVEQDFGNNAEFLHKQGALWFGDKNASTTQGNIKASNAVITKMNGQNKSKRIDSLYMEKLMQDSPEYMKVFRSNRLGSNQYLWDSWSGLYQPDGGSVDMRASYNGFKKFVESHKSATIYDKTTIQSYKQIKSEYKHQFKASGNLVIQSKNILICVGIYTPYFLKDIMNYPHLVENNYRKYINPATKKEQEQKNIQYTIQEYVASYIQIQRNFEQTYSKIPNYINFLKTDPTRSYNSGYGFRYHSWDTLPGTQSSFVKVGTMVCEQYNSLQKEQQFLKNPRYRQIQTDDNRVKAAIDYAEDRLKFLRPYSDSNKHYPCPLIFYKGRQTILDYLQRKNESIVVTSGGWIGKYYPLLAKTAVRMLFQAQKIKQERKNNTVIGSFLNRTRFTLEPYVNDRLKQSNTCYPKNGEFQTIIIGAGCSGLYAAYRLNKSNYSNIGVFDLSERISGRLKSFTFNNTTTPIELGGMRYIPTNHKLVDQIITQLGIPTVSFKMQGDPIQNSMKKAYLRSQHYQVDQWEQTQNVKMTLTTSYNVKGPVIGMNSFQIIAFSFYQILTAPQNINLLIQSFLRKTSEDIGNEKKKLKQLGILQHNQESYYRSWKNHVYQSKDNLHNYSINLTLKQWNEIKPVLLFRYRYQVTSKDIYLPQQKVPIQKLYPLYKFGFQNVIEAQFDHQTYLFVSEQNGYYSNTSNASYLDQVMTYLLDFGDAQCRTLIGGFDNINYAIANVLLDSQKGLPGKEGGIYLGHKLVNIVKEQGKYCLTFHIKTPAAPAQTAYTYKKCLLSGFQKSFLNKLQHQDCGIPHQLSKEPGISSIKLTAKRIILGIPKRSIQILQNEIDLLQRPITNYNYQKDFQEYSNILQYEKLRQDIKNLQKHPDLNERQNLQLQRLIQKQKQHFQNAQSQSLTPEEVKHLNQLSQRYLYNKVIAKTKIDDSYENKKQEVFKEEPPIIPTNLLELTESTQSMQAVKIVMNFKRNWWDPNIRLNEIYQKDHKNANLINSAEEMRGVSVTDLPVRQTLYFSSGQDNILMSSYNDMITTQFWNNLQNNFKKIWKPIQESDRKVISYPQNMQIHHAKEVVVRQLLKQLSLIHKITIDEKQLIECVYQFWGNDPFGAGYHNFYGGYYIPSVMKCIRRPWTQESIHFVGEAYSNETGWVEGAYQTTEKLLQEVYSVEPLIRNYYAGY